MTTAIEGVDSGLTFEAHARRYFSRVWNIDLQARKIKVGGTVDKQFDLVSADSRIVGDAKWYKNIGKPGAKFKVPPAKWSTISEYVWLLQNVAAERVFLVFGNEIEVPEKYLLRFGPLVSPVEFYFYDGTQHRLLS